MSDMKSAILLKDIFTEARCLVELATEKKQSIVTAESCTGGLIGAAITSIPGSSNAFKGGIIAYDNAVKTQQLGVPQDVLDTYGAVSAEVAETMAKGVLTELNADIAVSVTGIAGPGGGSNEKPVGTVWVGIATAEYISVKRLDCGDIGRNKVRDVTCYEALKAVVSVLERH